MFRTVCTSRYNNRSFNSFTAKQKIGLLLLRTHSIRNPRRQKRILSLKKERNTLTTNTRQAQQRHLHFPKDEVLKHTIQTCLALSLVLRRKVKKSPQSFVSPPSGVEQFSFFLCLGQVAQTAGVSTQLPLNTCTL